MTLTLSDLVGFVYQWSPAGLAFCMIAFFVCMVISKIPSYSKWSFNMHRAAGLFLVAAADFFAFFFIALVFKGFVL